MNVHGGADKRQQVSIGESTLTVKWWGVVAIVGTLFAAIFYGLMDHEQRITRTEESAKIILELKGTLRCIETELKTVNARLARIEARWEYKESTRE